MASGVPTPDIQPPEKVLATPVVVVETGEGSFQQGNVNIVAELPISVGKV